MSDTVRVSQIKTCDICRFIDKQDNPKAAAYDTKTIMGQWGNVCEDHYDEYGVGRLGTGFGQRLIYPDGALEQFNAEREVKVQLGGVVL